MKNANKGPKHEVTKESRMLWFMPWASFWNTHFSRQNADGENVVKKSGEEWR